MKDWQFNLTRKIKVLLIGLVLLLPGVAGTTTATPIPTRPQTAITNPIPIPAESSISASTSPSVSVSPIRRWKDLWFYLTIALLTGLIFGVGLYLTFRILG